MKKLSKKVIHQKKLSKEVIQQLDTVTLKKIIAMPNVANYIFKIALIELKKRNIKDVV